MAKSEFILGNPTSCRDVYVCASHNSHKTHIAEVMTTTNVSRNPSFAKKSHVFAYIQCTKRANIV